MTIDLSDNLLKTIPEKIFGHVINYYDGLHLSIKIDFTNNPFNCDCNMIWLLNNTIKSRIYGEIQCHNFGRQNLFNILESEFNCTTITTITTTISTTSDITITTESTVFPTTRDANTS